MSLKHKKWRTTQVDDKSSPELEIFTNNCDKLFKKFAQNKIEMPNANIYHYTTVDVLMKILKTRSLWMSDFKTLNTRNKDSEIDYAVKQLERLVEENCHRSPHKEFWDGFLLRVRDIPSAFNIYICSYCLSRDQQYVWEKYANNGKGIAIGFDTKYFFMKKNIRNSMILTGHKVHYQSEDFSNYVSKFIHLADNILQAQKLTSPYNNKIYNDIGGTLLRYLIILLPKLKKAHFSEENEYRTFLMEFASDKIVPPKTYREYCIPPQEKTIRSTDNGKVDVAIYKFKKDELSEIWFGPKCEVKEACIKKILHMYQYTNVNISHL